MFIALSFVCHVSVTAPLAMALIRDVIRPWRGRATPACVEGLIASYMLAVWLMAVAMRSLDMGINYAVWAASGTAASFTTA
jgi:multidrug transporter EmrE-like cation transporter